MKPHLVLTAVTAYTGRDPPFTTNLKVETASIALNEVVAHTKYQEMHDIHSRGTKVTQEVMIKC